MTKSRHNTMILVFCVYNDCSTVRAYMKLTIRGENIIAQYATLAVILIMSIEEETSK